MTNQSEKNSVEERIRRREIIEKAAQKAREKEERRPMNPDYDFSWENTNFERNDYD